MTRLHKAPGPGIRYSSEFKQSAVQLLLGGTTLAAASKKLGVSIPTLISWKKKYHKAQKPPELQSVTTGRSDDAADELRALRFELEKVVEERDRLRRSIAVLIGVTPST